MRWAKSFLRVLFFALLLLLLFSTWVTPSETGTIVFQTNFFSVDRGRLPQGWAGSGSVVAANALNGHNALQVDDTSTTKYGYVYSVVIPVQAGSAYQVQVSGKSDVTDRPGSVGLFIYEVKGNGKTGAAHSLWFPKTNEWETTFTTIVPEDGTEGIRMHFYSAARGTGAIGSAWFDAIEVRKVQMSDKEKSSKNGKAGNTDAVSTDAGMTDAFGKALSVSDREDVTIVMKPEEFWNRVPEVAITPNASSPIFSFDLLRRAYFDVDMNLPQKYKNTESQMREVTGKLGVVRSAGDPTYVVAADLRFHPIMHTHSASTGSYSNKYYPRRMQDWINGNLHPLYIMTGDEKYFTRMQELLDFLLFSQYDANGNNEFTSTYFPGEFATLHAAGLTKEWYGGWDYLFDWEWKDAYGYKWHLHEPDHHVNSLIAVSMIRGYETTGEERYLNSAAKFVYNQIPRYGWHTGVWSGLRYYWTEYNPSGPGNPVNDATDNVQGLVAESVAMVGYYKNDSKLLEFARGLLWYMAREYVTDGAWYYDGAENPLNQRRTKSHELVCLSTALRALPYLIKAGVDMESLIPALEKAYAQYKGVSNGTAYKVASPLDEAKENWRITTYFRAGDGGASDMRISDAPPYALFGFAQPDEYLIRVSRLLPPETGRTDWVNDSRADVVYRLSRDGMQKGFSVPFSLDPGDVLRVSYDIVRTKHRDGPTDPGRTSVFFQSGSSKLAATVDSINMAPGFAMDLVESDFLALPARMFFPFPDETNVSVKMGPAPKAVDY